MPDRDPFAEFDALVQQLEEGLERTRAPGQADEPPRPRRSSKATLALWGVRAAWVGSALLLPFYLLVGSSVFFYRNCGAPTWPALLAGVLLTVLLLLLYSAWITKRVSGKARMPGFLPKTLLAVVGAYCLYALIYISSMNVKGGVEET